MNLFDALVTEALKNQTHLSPLRIVVEKELLHHDILRTLRDNYLMAGLTFIGGTCLRACYGGVRLSEDLDFTGGNEFSRDSLATMGQILIESLSTKYGLQVIVSEPVKDRDQQNVDTWKIKIETRPEHKHIPSQRINIDICALPSYEKQPMMLLNPYGVDMGTSGLIIQAQSREEIYTDKLIAFAFRPNRVKYRDLWDISWLHGQGIKPRLELIPNKLQDRNYNSDYFLKSYEERQKWLIQRSEMAGEFHREMCRFLSGGQTQTLEQPTLWPFIVYLIEDLGNQIRHSLKK